MVLQMKRRTRTKMRMQQKMRKCREELESAADVVILSLRRVAQKDERLGYGEGILPHGRVGARDASTSSASATRWQRQKVEVPADNTRAGLEEVRASTQVAVLRGNRRLTVVARTARRRASRGDVAVKSCADGRRERGATG